jgi:limonene 1,2-monooxygenase
LENNLIPSRLRFGLFMQPIHHPRENPTLALERDMQLIEHADRLGFDEAWIGEHHSTGWETISAPDIFIAAAAARTRHIMLGTGITQLAIHHPFHVINRAIQLDHMTRGRARLGVGIGGGLPSDLHVFGVDMAQAHARFYESYDFITRLLETTEPITQKTDWFEVRDAVLQLRPYSQPFTIAVASDAPQSLERVGQQGGYWLAGAKPAQVNVLIQHAERGATSAGRTFSRSQIALLTTMHLAETRQQALDEVRAGAAEEQYDFKIAVNGQPQSSVSREDWIDHAAERFIIGTPDDAVERINTMLETSGGFGCLLFTTKEWASREANLRSYELCARYVMPRLQGALVGLEASAAAVARVMRRD